ASWWPKPNIWENSGLNTGYWTSSCEAWYQARLIQIREGTVALRSSTEWKRALRFNHKTPALRSTYEGVVGEAVRGCSVPYVG
ncbi:hypothetical protein M422DRAFT_38945, partial [Sphaerobolus stellatus SS14]